MRNSLAKPLRLDVAVKLYTDDEVSVEDVLKNRKDVFASPEFKRVMRARKKNEKRKPGIVKHMLVDTGYDVKAKQMHDKRIEKANREKRYKRFRSTKW